jgi:hypothetical protein
MTIAEMAPETEESTIADPQARVLVGAAINAMREAKSPLAKLHAIRDCVAGLRPGDDYDALDHLSDVARDMHRLPDDAISAAIKQGRDAATMPRAAAGECATERAAAVLRPLNLGDFLELQLPPRRSILAPWLAEKGTAMIYAARGVGKTLLGLSAGYAIASGDSFLGWSASEPRRVLYVDGEMPAVDMQRRLAAIVSGFTQRSARLFPRAERGHIPTRLARPGNV